MAAASAREPCLLWRVAACTPSWPTSTPSEALSLYTRPRGVWITCLCPGPVATNMSSDAHWFGPRVSIQVASGLAKLNAGDVGEMVAAAIENNQFFVLTHPEVGASMVARAAEPDHYLAEAIAQVPGA